MKLEVWDAKTSKKFLEKIREERVALAVMLAYQIGLRESDIEGLCWKDVDFNEGTLNI